MSTKLEQRHPLDCRFDDVPDLQKRAARLRLEEEAMNPYWPHIPCAGPGCGAKAVELYFFCSERCRVAYEQTR